MTDNLDSVIKDDLAHLGDNSRVNLPSFDETVKRAGVDRGTYRDGTAGAEARRDDLLKKRSLELALLPLSAARVYVHRVSRAAAGAVAVVGSVVVGFTVADPTLMRLASYFAPELNLSLVIVGLGVTVLATYVIAGIVAERIFEGRMRRRLRTTGDAFEDLDSLAEGPIDEARRLARSVESASVAWPLAGVVTAVPLLGFLSLIYAPLWVGSRWGMQLGSYGSYRVMLGNIIFVGLASLVALGLVYLLAQAIKREHLKGRSKIVELCSSIGVLITALSLGLIVFLLLSRSVFGIGHATYMSGLERLFVAVGGTLAVLGFAAWFALWMRRRENGRLEIE